MMTSKIGGGKKRLEDVGRRKEVEVDMIIEEMSSVLDGLIL